jgi:hypothetical protein
MLRRREVFEFPGLRISVIMHKLMISGEFSDDEEAGSWFLR